MYATTTILSFAGGVRCESYIVHSIRNYSGDCCWHAQTITAESVLI